MVNKFFKFINKEIDGLHQAAYLLGVFAILSQFLALIRDRLLAGAFGAGGILDTYYAAFRIPDFIFISVGSMVSISVLIPFLIDRAKTGEGNEKKFISNIFSFFFLMIVVVSIIVFFFVPSLSALLFPGFKGEKLADVISLTRILLLSPIFLGLSNILGTLTQAHKRFFIYALSPVLYNIGIIIGIFFIYPVFGLSGLAYGVIFGAFLHLAIQLPFIIEHGLFPRLNFKFDFKEIKKVLFVSLPRTFTLGFDNISVIFLLSIASLMASGSIAIFNFSFNLQSVPLSIVGVSYSLAAFPILARLFSNGEKGKFMQEIIVSARHIIFWSIPIATLFIVLRAQIVRTILGSGSFDWNDTRLTAAALAIFSASIVFQNLTLLFVRAYYATGNTIKPFIAKLINAISTILLGYLFAVLFQRIEIIQSFLENVLRVKGIAGTVILTLPLGWSVGEFINTIALWFVFHKDFKGFTKPVLNTLYQVLTASVIMGFVSYICLNIFDKIFSLETALGIFLQGLFSGLIGIVCLIAVLKMIKNQELVDVWKTLKTKVWKQPKVAPDPNVV